MGECQKCGSANVFGIYAKCNDLFELSKDGRTIKSGYVPTGIGIDSGGSELAFDLCFACGTVQGEWPNNAERFLPKEKLINKYGGALEVKANEFTQYVYDTDCGNIQALEKLAELVGSDKEVDVFAACLLELREQFGEIGENYVKSMLEFLGSMGWDGCQELNELLGCDVEEDWEE